MVEMGQQIQTQRDRLLVALGCQLLQKRGSLTGRALGEHAREHLVCSLIAHADHRTKRFALHQRLRIGEQVSELGEPLAAAELPEQERGGLPHFPVGRVQELTDGVPAAGAEADQDVPHGPSDLAIVFGGERLGQRHHDAGAERGAQLFDVAYRGLVAGAQPCQGVTHRRSGDHPVEGLSREAADRVGLDRYLVVGTPLGEALEELQRSLEVARQGEALDMTADRAGDIAPTKRVGFHSQQIEQQLQVERPEGRVADRRQPRFDPFLRVVADVLDLDRLRSCGVQLAGVLVVYELLVAIRRQQRLGLFPDVRKGVGLAERGLGHLLSNETHHLTPFVEVGHQGLERLGEPM